MRSNYNHLILLLFLFLLNSILIGQQTLPFEENFAYTTGDLVTVGSSVWSQATSISSVPVQVIAGSLTYTGYPSSGSENKIFISGGASRQRVYMNFTDQDTSGVTIYLSFLLNVTDLNNLTSGGDYFASLTTAASSTGARDKVWARLSSTSGKFNLGISKVSTPEWSSTDFDSATTYLIVMGYQFNPGTGDDLAQLWVNPDLSGSIPAADISQSSGSDVSDIGGLRFEQNTSTPNAEIDGIRVSTSWDNSPMPVELSSFTAYSTDNTVTLKWETATEVNNYGFEIERKIPDQVRNDNSGWQKIGFINGAGNSNAPNSYSFKDNPAGGTFFSYRLKQIDVDGGFKYYDAVTVSLSALTEAKLMQNSPNPFNPSTRIKFYIPNDSDVKIQIFDALGREVKTLLNGQNQAGYHIVYWNGQDKYGKQAASGIYLYRLIATPSTGSQDGQAETPSTGSRDGQAGTFVETKKMLLLK